MLENHSNRIVSLVLQLSQRILLDQVRSIFIINPQYGMKALILVGGYGTRMRPLTINVPKSAFPFANWPMVEHQIAALARIGVVQVILAISYQAHYIKNALQPLEAKYKIRLTYSQQTEPLGTAGPLKLAQTILRNGNQQGLFFVFNSDIICDFPLEQLLKFHKTHNRQGTILLAHVADPSRFGVVVSDIDGKVKSFVEKPVQFISNKINAGMYLLNVSVLNRIPERFCMIEKEIFPALAAEGQLYSLPLKNNFWFDIGQPKDYLLGQGAYLTYYKINSQDRYHTQIDKTAVVEQNCKIGPNVVIGAHCLIKSGTALKNCTILANTIVGHGCYIENSIISWRCKIGNWVRIEGLTCIAQQVQIKDESRVTDSMVLSNKAVTGVLEHKVAL